MNNEMIELSRLASGLQGSQILEYSGAVKAMQGRGRIVNNYTVGDFDPSVFPIPIELKNEIMKAYAEGYTNYPMAEGNMDLRSAIGGFERRFAGIDYAADEVVVASGGRPLIYAVFQVICDEGDGVIYGTPSWNNHYFIQTVNAKGIEIRTEAKDGFLLTPDQIAHHIREATLLCLCSPQNPTGTVYSKKTLQTIANMVVEENSRRKHGKKLYVLFDAMYGCLTTGYLNYNPLRLNEQLGPYLVTVNGISKIFAATGLRLGWCLGPKAVLQKVKNLLNHVGAWAPMAEQKAVARFLFNGDAVSNYLSAFREELYQRLMVIYTGIIALKKKGYPVNAIKPQGGIYLSVKINLIGKSINKKPLNDAHGIAHYLLETTSLAILPFAVFGAAGDLPWFRVSIGTCRKVDIPVILIKLEAALKRFQKPRPKRSIPKQNGILL